MFDLISKAISIVFESFKALFFFQAGKTSAKAETQQDTINNVTVAKKVEDEVRATNDIDARNKLRKFTKN